MALGSKCIVLTAAFTALARGNSARVLSTARRYSSSGDDKASYDVVIVGGGIVGLATAQELIARHPHLSFGLVEKESELAVHQTGHNSGVIHAGIYYKPGSLMAKLCVEGLHSTYKYCDKYGIDYKKCGKLVVATNDLEVKRLRDLFGRALQNKVPDIELIKGAEEIKKYEPHCRGLEALWSPHTGIVDWAQVARMYGTQFQKRGGQIHLDFEVSAFDDQPHNPEKPVRIRGKRPGQEIECGHVLTCAGLQSDRVSVLTGCKTDPKIVPFRGEYLLLSPEKAKLIRGNIYPVPDPAFPFLGVHFTPRMNGEVWLGPNAVLAFKREGYSWFDISFRDLWEVLKYPGFYRLAAKYLKYGSSEMLRSIVISLSVKELQKFVPEVTSSDIQRGPAGVRAQAMNAAGDLVGDFVFDGGDSGAGAVGQRVIHCRNAPSPGATSSLAIGRMMADKMEDAIGLPKNGNAVLY